MTFSPSSGNRSLAASSPCLPILRILKGLIAAAVILALAGCYPSGRSVAGVAETDRWFSLPFEDFLHEGDAEPEALSFCASEDCPDRLAIGVIKVTGNSAEQLRRILRRPDLLVMELEARKRKPTLSRAAAKTDGQHIDTTLKVVPFHHEAAQGFSLVMSRKDGKGHVAGMVLGWRSGEALHVVIAIGNSDNAVMQAAVQAVNHYTDAASR